MFETYWKYDGERYTVLSVRYDESKNKTMFLIWWGNEYSWIDSEEFKDRR
jgi:hypothetical protein